MKLFLFKVGKSDACIRPLLQIQSHFMIAKFSFQFMDNNPATQMNIKCDHKRIFKRESTEALNLKQLEPYLCFICHELLFQAMQLSCCGYRLCSACLNQLQR